ncbi:LARGE xylosyl- and glucuronyltransferase 2-like isoform X2 [Neodiprion fabricii]|uniref:LARGE xylosyl- and glucuronyltransferase 2-like isoform X2 n=1 Tax=Neodiprion fabricii TaxID=2872261 RepID=UPI001ED94E23|nr:LARGE xylosyl- and glucuronyltransferase 2-like isoform X2 [Neodiprion fabricii]
MARPWIRCFIGAIAISTMFYFYLFSNESDKPKKALQADLKFRKVYTSINEPHNLTGYRMPDEQHQPQRNVEVTSFHLSSSPTECSIIHVAMVCAGYNSTFTTVIVVKSILFYRRNPLHFHFIVDEIANTTLFMLFESWNLPNVQLSYYKSAELVPRVAWIPNKHYSGVYGLLKLILPEVLSVDKVIVLDTDVTILTDILRLWKLFDNFESQHLIGLVENQSDWYSKPSARNPFPWPALGRGFNTGVILMHLKRLRSMEFLKIWEKTSRGTLEEISETHLADQDIINAVIKKYPSILYRLDCTWNVQLSVQTLSENCYTNTNEINIIHWNSPKKQDVTNKHIDDFRKAYQIFLELDGNLLRRQLFPCQKADERVFSQNSETGHGTCQKFEESSRINYRTYLFLLEYENNFRYIPDVTLITQCSGDRLTLLEDLCKRWRGAISVALYFTDADTYNFIKFVRGSEELSKRRNIAYHVVYKEGEFYPVNYLRNVGMSHVTTSYVFQLDVDFLPSNGLYDTLMSSIVSLRLTQDRQVALIVPAFETERYRFNFPESKEALVRSLNRGMFYTFRYHIWSQGHAATNYTHWCKASEPYEVGWEPDFEPYVVVPSSAPSYDTRFVGFGWNKVSHIAHLAAMGYRFVVLPDAFVIHRPHAPSFDIVKFRQDSLYRRCLKKLKDTFVDELLRKYEASAVSNLKKRSRSSGTKVQDEKEQNA